MKRRNRLILTRLMATTSIVALTLTAAPIVLDPQIGGAALSFAESGSSCFVAGTQVLMADGSERPIEAVRPGDLVRGGRGGVNRVAAVETPRLGARRLYAFNGGRAFVTAEHPFLTMAGWKAIDPAATARENAALEVAALSVGDLLTMARPAVPQGGGDNLARDCEVEFWLQPLKTVNACAADPETTVYNLLLDGNHSYIADGFVVHNKGGDDDGGGGGEGGGGEGGDDNGGDDNGGEGGESGESGDDDGGESGESGEGGESGDDDDDDDAGEGGESGSDDFFPGDPGAADRDLTAEEEEDLIGRGWQ